MSDSRGVTSNKKLALTITASFISYLVTFGISFILSPYIVEKVGVEAYGFVGLANNFVSYATLAAVALNALAGRFITVKIYENDIEGANRYFSSVLISNGIISVFIMTVLTIVWVFLENIVDIPSNFLWDVKLLFAAVFVECVLSTFGSVFAVSTFATNNLHLNSLRTIESSIARAVILVLLFMFFSPNIWYLGVTALLMTLYCVLYNIHYTRKLLPFIHISFKYFDIGAVKTLLISGVWSLITRLGALMSEGLDLLITNIFIDSTSMGVLSLAKTIPSLIQSIIGTMVEAFSPNFTILYAQKKTEELVKALKQSMKIMGIISNLPIIILIVCGERFFALWQPTQDARTLYILSIMTCAGFILNGGINCVFNIFVVVNKLKVNSIAVVISGAINVVIVLILLNVTELGIYAVAAVSTIITILRNLIIIIPYSAKCLGLKWNSFYPDAIRPVIFTLISSALGILLIIPIPHGGWMSLIVCGAITGSISVLIGFFVILSRSDRAVVINKLLRRKHE
ncbi:Membrane protein involved in the export of O-antigen and teichoic acid [Ruminococcaceae bacterium FB2012]|nr:Membrane protein involved in the export of O-antigen and teichoic acid [Ruminococcaceae bacterium FB2012]